MNSDFDIFSAGVGPGQNPVGNYYTPVHSYHPSGFSNGYTPLQPTLNEPPAYISTEPTAPPAIPGTYSDFSPTPPVSTIPVTIQPTASGQPIIGFTPPPAYGQPITSQPMPTGPAPMNYGTPLPGPTGKLMYLYVFTWLFLLHVIIILNGLCL